MIKNPQKGYNRGNCGTLILVSLADVNRLLGLREEGMQRGKEALEIYKQLGDTLGQAQCLNQCPGHSDMVATNRSVPSHALVPGVCGYDPGSGSCRLRA
jgi:hypothetical protein